MFRKILIVYISLMSLLILIAISCDVTVDDCGPFDDKFKTVDFETELISISISDTSTLDVQYSVLEKDTVQFDKFGLFMFPIGEHYSFNMDQLKSFSLFPSALACTYPIPVSEEIITGIQIFSDKDFNSEYASGDNLADLFDVVVLYLDSGYQRYDLTNFLSTDPNVPNEIILLLKSAPETTDRIQLTVQYSQDGIDLDSYEFTTNPVVITD